MIIMVMFCTVSIYFSGCSEKATQQQNNNQEANVPMEGYGIILINPSGELNKSFVVNIKNSNQFNYNLKFMNHSGHEDTFSLSTLVDYKQIPFQLANQKNFMDTYQFTAKDAQDVVIPVRFPLDSLSPSSHVLTFSIVAGPNKHASSMKSSTSFYGTTARYTLRTDSSNSSYDNNAKPEESKNVLSSKQFQGILLNDDTISTDKLTYPPVKLNAKPGEKLDLAMRGGGYSDTEDYLAWVTIGGKQVSIDQNNLVWYFHVPLSRIAFRKIQIVAPNEPGDYEVCSYLVANPWKVMDDGFNQNIGIDTSYRFTLHVE